MSVIHLDAGSVPFVSSTDGKFFGDFLKKKFSSRNGLQFTSRREDVFLRLSPALCDISRHF